MTQLRLYLDLVPGTSLDYVCAYANPGIKPKGCKRLAIDVEIPDFNDTDAVVISSIVEDDAPKDKKEATFS